MNRYEFKVHITPEAFLRFYRGDAKHVVVRATSGQNVQLPAAMFRPFVAPEGVHGHFVLTCDERKKAIGLERL